MSIHLCTWKCVSTKAHLFPSKTSPIRRIFILFLCRETKTVLCRKCWATAWSLTANWTYHCDAELKMTISTPRWFPIASVQTSLQLQVVVHSFLWNWFQWLSLGYLFEPAKFIYLMIVAVKFQKSKSNRLTHWPIFSVQVVLEPKNQEIFVGSIAEMFCHANASIFQWKVIHLDFQNSSSSQRLISVYHNETKQELENMINATLLSKDTIVNILYVFNISEKATDCFLEGEYFCVLEFLDDAVQTTSDRGTLTINGEILWLFLADFTLRYLSI